MLDQMTRAAILRLREEGHGTRSIAKAVGISRGAVREVLRAGTAEVPRLERPELGEAHQAEIAGLYAGCKGNLVRVHEKLREAGATLSYQALTAFCRRHGLGHEPVKPAGQYHFAPGEEMQHDTSPHDAQIGGKLRRVQTASLVLCYSRMIYIQCYPSFTRFACKLFLADALQYFGGAARRCMIDNTHVVVLHGTGKDMVAVPEMAAFAERYGFAFAAHEKGDANRSARVERPFDFIENNFLAHPVRILEPLSSPVWTGPAEPMASVARQLQRKGHEVEMAVDTLRGGDLRQRLSAMGFTVRSDLFLSTKASPLASLRDLIRLRRMARDFDILHAHFSHDHALALLAHGSARVVRTVHSTRSLRQRPLQGLLHRSADGLIAVCQAHAQLLHQRFGSRSGVVASAVVCLPSGAASLRAAGV